MDIKPYIPFVEAKPDASSGFVSGKPEELNVVWAESTFAEHLSTEEKHLIEQSIAQDPRPAYQDIPERIYVMNIADYEVQFRIENKCATVIKSIHNSDCKLNLSTHKRPSEMFRRPLNYP